MTTRVTPAAPRWHRWLLLAAALVGAAIAVRLGVWQLSRADQKLTLQSALLGRGALPPLAPKELAKPGDEAGAAQQHYRRIDLQGQWLPALTVYLENRQMNARPGFFALTPLQLG